VPGDDGAPGTEGPGARTDRPIPAEQHNGDGQPGTGPSAFPFDYADDFQGDISADVLTAGEEDYRRSAYESALHYTGNYGLFIFPVWWMNAGTCACPAGARCDNPAKHPCDQGWPEQASDDPEHAARWWRPRNPAEDAGEDWRPKANLGVLMGVSVFLLDVDISDDKTGDESLTTLIAHHGQDLPHSLCYHTGSGGRGFILQIPPGTEVRNSVSELADHLDIRGVRGFGIVPPSVSGKGPYAMVADTSPAPPPRWLAGWLADQQRKREERLKALPKGEDGRQAPAEMSRRTSAYIRSALESAAQRVAEAPEKTRNNTLNTEAFNIFSKFGTAGLLDPGEIATAFKAAAESCHLRGAEIVRTLRSSFEGAQLKPRSNELPDFIFEEPVPAPKVPPSITSAIYSFERLYDLRRSTTGEFISRPTSAAEPPLVGDIGEELGHRLRLWWRYQAESWNDHIAQVIGKIDPDAPPKKDGDEDAFVAVFPPDATFSNTLSHLKASATGHEPVIQHTRCFSDGRSRVVVDLCDSDGMVTEITADGFRLADPRAIESKPWFRRGSDMGTQARPVLPVDVYDALAEAAFILTVSEDQWKVILGGLIGGHFSLIDRPGFWLTGPSGAGKTTRGRMIAGWLDPSTHLGGKLNMRRDDRDARVRAMHRFLVTMDNMTYFSQDENDFWCRLHTGVSEAARKLHSDNVMLSFVYKRLGLATSLTLPAGLKPDALRRLLHIDLGSSDSHPDISELWERYDNAKPRILGALYSVLAGVLRELAAAEAEDLPDCPEMSDYARRLRAADRAYPELGLYQAYVVHTAEVQLHHAADDPFIGLIKRWLEALPGAEFTGSPTAFHTQLSEFAGLATAEQWWPKSAKAVGKRMIELSRPLELSGILYTSGWAAGHGREVTLKLLAASMIHSDWPQAREEAHDDD
jgi:hypothetical protein